MIDTRRFRPSLLLKIILWKASVDVYGFEGLERDNSRATPDFDQLLMSIFIGELSSRLSLHHGTALHVQIPFLFYISSPLPNWFTSGLQCLLLICFFRQLGSLSINQPLATGINKSKKRPKKLEWWGVFFVSGFYYGGNDKNLMTFWMSFYGWAKMHCRFILLLSFSILWTKSTGISLLIDKNRFKSLAVKIQREISKRGFPPWWAMMGFWFWLVSWR